MSPAILEYGRSSDRLISWITLIKAAFSIQVLKMFCHGLILYYRTVIRPSSPAPSMSTSGSSSSHQTGEWPQNATSTVLRSLVALISPYPKEPARGQFSVGTTTSPVMLTTVRSVVSSGQEFQQILSWTSSMIHLVSLLVKSTLFCPPWSCLYLAVLLLLLSGYYFCLLLCFIYHTSFIHVIILQIVYHYTYLYYHVSFSAVVPIILKFVYHSHKCHFPVIFHVLYTFYHHLTNVIIADTHFKIFIVLSCYCYNVF